MVNSLEWQVGVDAFVRAFAARAKDLDDHPGDLDPNASAATWAGPDHPADILDATYRGGIVPPEQRGAAEGWDRITILRARGRRLAKLICRDGTIEDYAAAKRFDMVAVPVDGIDHLEEDLRRLLQQPDRCVVRGAIADLGRTMGVRRLLHPDAGDPATLVEVPRRWLALDIDSLPLPEKVAIDDIARCAEVAITQLPLEFHPARCIAQATASHGLKPGIRMRLWYWLDRPVTGSELKRWFAPAPVDHSLFSAAQIIYTAAPLFDGRPDPLPQRIVRLPGTGQVAVPEIPEPAPRPEPKPVKPTVGLSPYGAAALNSACRRIAEAREGERDKAIRSAAYSIGSLAGGGAVPAAFARNALHQATSRIPGYSKRDAAKVDRSFGSGLRNPRETPYG